MVTPSDVLEVLEKLESTEQETIKTYISKLESEIQDLKGDGEPPSEANDDMEEDKTVDFPPLYKSGEDMDAAGQFKMEASDLKAEGKWEDALEKYTQAVLAAPPSALLYANRAMVLLKLERFKAAERDCSEALKINPDSAKAFRIRGKAYEHMEMWEQARSDLSAAQTIDFDEGTVQDMKLVVEKMNEIEAEKAKKKVEDEGKLRKRAEEIKKAQREAQEEAARSSAGMAGMPGMPPGGSMPGMGGMGGMPPGAEGLMGSLLSDPELAAAMQNPKVMAALQELMGGPGGPMAAMSNPEKMQEIMSDPEVGPVLQKLMSKLGGAGGMGSAGGMGGSMGGVGDDIPNMGDDDDAMPDLD